MLARIRPSAKEDQGFTLIELLVVMIIIGILAAIAIPVFLSQRQKAQDTAAKSDISIIGKEVATYYVDQTGTPTLAISSGSYTINGTVFARVSTNVSAPAFHGAAAKWCVDVTNTGGTQSNWKYSSAAGLASGACATPADY